MEWIIEHRERVREDLAAAKAAEQVAADAYQHAQTVWHAARDHRHRVEAVLAALDQIDPSTRTPEPPL